MKYITLGSKLRTSWQVLFPRKCFPFNFFRAPFSAESAVPNAYWPEARLPTTAHRRGSRLGAGCSARSSTVARGCASTCPGRGGIVHSPSAALHRARCTATDNALHHRRAQPWPAAARRTAGARAQSDELFEQTLGLVVPAPSDFGSQHAQALWPPEGKFRAARVFASCSRLYSAAPSRSAAPRVGLPSRPSGDTSVASQLGCAIDDEIKAPSVIRPHTYRGRIGEPLLRYHSPFRADRLTRDLHPRLLEHEATSCYGAGARTSREVVPQHINSPTAAWQANPSAAGSGNRQGESEAAPQGEVHQVRGELGSWVRGDSTKPKPRMWA